MPERELEEARRADLNTVYAAIEAAYMTRMMRQEAREALNRLSAFLALDRGRSERETDRIDPRLGDERELCGRCGRHYAVWFAPSPLWNRVMRGEGYERRGEPFPFICPTCFALFAEEKGVYGTAWVLDVEALTAQDPPPERQGE